MPLKIQNNILRFLYYQCNIIQRTPHSNCDMLLMVFLLLLTIMPLDIIILKLLHELLNNVLSCLKLIERLNFRINLPIVRNKSLFYLPN